MSRILSIIVFLLAAFIAKSQVKDDDYVLRTPRDYDKDPARSANFIELLGNAGLYSLNTDYIFLYRNQFKISGRLGGNIFPTGYYIEQAYVIENNYIFLPNPHHIEVGPGLTLQRKYNVSCTDSTVTHWESFWFGMFRIGYRYQQQEDGFFFRAGFTPIFYRKNDCNCDSPILTGGKWFWAGLAVGVSF